MKVDQAHMETVIPAIGKNMMQVKGTHHGCEAILMGLVEEDFCCTVRLQNRSSFGKVLQNIAYEHLSKFFVAALTKT